MRILIDLICLQTGSKHRGIGRYSLNLSRSLCELCKDDEILFLTKDTPLGSPTEIAKAIHPHSRHLIKSIHLPETDIDCIGNESGAVNATLQHLSLNNCYKILSPDIRLTCSHFEWEVDYEIAPKRGTISSVILYDLIPLIFKDKYLSNRVEAKAYEKKIKQLNGYDLIFAISETTKRDAINLLGINPNKIVNISAACESFFTPPKITLPQFRTHGISRKFLYYTGNIDPRKNCESLIQAYGQIGPELRKTHQLAITTPINREIKEKFNKIIQKYNINSDEIILTGPVSDKELLELYQNCTAFVFPSLYEGFGLPVLEAIACGAPTIASNNSSITEIINRSDALFDATDVNNIAHSIKKILSDEDFRKSLSQDGINIAKKFSWEKSARLSYEAWVNIASSKALPLRTSIGPESKKTNTTQICTKRPPHDFHELTKVLNSFNINAIAESDWQICIRKSKFRDNDEKCILKFDYFRQEIQLSILDYARSKHVIVLFPSEPPPLHTYQFRPTRLDYAEAIIENSAGIIFQEPPLFDSKLIQFAKKFRVPNIILAQTTPQAICGFLNEFLKNTDTKTLRSALAHITPEIESFSAIRTWIAQSMDADPSLRCPRIYIDLTDFTERWNSGYITGIERTVSSIVKRINARMDCGLWPISLDKNNSKDFNLVKKTELNQYEITETIVKFQPGDRIIIPNVRDRLNPTTASWSHLISRGVEIHVILYDILATRYPHFFPKGDDIAQRDYLVGITQHADFIHAISRTAADDYILWCYENQKLVNRPSTLSISHFPLGYDALQAHTHIAQLISSALPEKSTELCFISVGTIEPRKGYDLSITAFEMLWNDGLDAKYVIIGREGWMTKATIQRILHHREFGRRLIWLKQAADEELCEHYQKATALISMSTAEGYGLPLVEAASQGASIIASNTPIYKEICGQGAHYFNLDTPESLTACIKNFLRISPEERALTRNKIIKYTWDQSSEILLNNIIKPNPYKTINFNNSDQLKASIVSN